MIVRVDTSGLEKYKKLVAGGFMRDVLTLWAKRYRADQQERFDKFSKGGGDWPPLAQSTIEGRRHGGKGGYKRGKGAMEAAVAGGGGQVSILRDTNTLFMVLDPSFSGRPGQLQEFTDDGVRVGFGGPGRYPDGSASVADIARFHDEGGGRLPQRKLLDEPTQETRDGMRQDLERGCERAARASEVR